MTALLMALTLLAAYFAGFTLLRTRFQFHFEWKTIAPVLYIFALTALISASQFAEPKILSSLQRDREALTNGQIWRLVTPLFVQDGGGAGTIYNLATLLLLGIPASLLFGWQRWLLLYFGTGVTAEIVAYALIHQGFAGNSIANFGVAALISLASVRARRVLPATFGVGALVCGLLLLVVGNLHGAAFLIGSLISLAVFRRNDTEFAG